MLDAVAQVRQPGLREFRWIERYFRALLAAASNDWRFPSLSTLTAVVQISSVRVRDHLGESQYMFDPKAAFLEASLGF